MEKVKSIIQANLVQYPHFEEYFKIIDIIDTHEMTNPDICIESCKALVEGISKTILIELDHTKTPENIDSGNVPKLFNSTIKILAEKCHDLEGDFAMRFSPLVQVLTQIRNKRGDISHGRVAPKPIFSSSKLATTFKTITDSMLEYILEHYFSIDRIIIKELVYDFEIMEGFNVWLDSQYPDFPIISAPYSKVLYDYDYKEYRLKYEAYFFEELGISEEKILILEEAMERQQLKLDFTEEQILAAEEMEEKQRLEIEELLSQEDEISRQEKIHLKRLEEEQKLIERIIEEEKEGKTGFDVSIRELKFEPVEAIEYWNDSRMQVLEDFSTKNKLDSKELKRIINLSFAIERSPLREQVARTMLERPALKDRKTILEQLTQKIVELIKQLNTMA
ncbi:MAG: hypothetical protein AAF806_26040 [Bacteroidota bacterium]